MTYQRRLLPSTSMLMALDAVARTNSFTRAAEELNLTQGAISRQISALEDQLGVILFRRVKKMIQITDIGKRYSKEIHSALQTIRNASLDAISNPLSGTLNLAILPTFGTRWLMPKFPSFLSKHPDITVNFVTKLSPFDFNDENIHAAIHYGLENWPNTESTFLMGEQSVPVCSPLFLNENPVNTVNDIEKMPLLHLASRPQAWEEWLNIHKLKPPKQQGMLFEQISIIAQAAVNGMGVALLPKFLIESEINRGELVIVNDISMENQFGYYLVTPVERSDYAPVVAFRDWLLFTARPHKNITSQ